MGFTPGKGNYVGHMKQNKKKKAYNEADSTEHQNIRNIVILLQKIGGKWH